MEFSRQEYWSGWLFPTPEDLPDPRGSNPSLLPLLHWQADSLLLHRLGSPSTPKWSEVKLLSHVRLFVIPWTVAFQIPLSMEFSRQEYWSGLPFFPPGDLPDPGIEHMSPALTSFFTAEPSGKFHLLECLSSKSQAVSSTGEAVEKGNPWHNWLLFFLLFSHQVVSSSLRPYGLQRLRFLCPSLSLEVCSNSCPLSLWCYLTISSSAALFSFCLQFFPASGSFPRSQLFTSGGQIIGVSALASVLLWILRVYFL